MESAGGPATRVSDSELEYGEELIYRWRGEPFTGIGYDDSPPSGLSEVSYRNRMQEGPAQDWYPSGVLRGESVFRENVLHGVVTEYAENGDVRSEAVYEYGIALSKSERGEDGEFRQIYRLADDSPNRRLLEGFRRDKRWPEIS
jgi:antitoxin component YwqK of YwqJK toxin-antitoxin module